MTTTNHLFAYGTLMAAAGRREPGGLGAQERRRLASEGRLLGGATMAGWLYDLGNYPGLVESVAGHADEAGVVEGELWWLDDPDAAFRWLDVYEGIDAARPEHGEYRRVVRGATACADGRPVEAWVYLLAVAPEGAAPIPDGSWLRPEMARGTVRPPRV